MKIAQYAGKQTVFHLSRNRPIYFDRFLEVVHALAISMKVVDGDSFNHALRRLFGTGLRNISLRRMRIAGVLLLVQ